MTPVTRVRMLPPAHSGVPPAQHSGVSSIGDGTLTSTHTPTRGGLFLDQDQCHDIHFRCDDDSIVKAHKHVLGQRCKYYYEKLCRGRPAQCVVNVDHTAAYKEYGFRGSSSCCRAMLQFFYMGYILELEDPEISIEALQQQIADLLEFSLIRGRDGLGGLAEYLVNKLSTKGLMDASTAVQRLDLAIRLASSVGPDTRIQILIDAMKHTIPGLKFTVDAFCRGLVDPDTVELILRDVPLPADEVDVCRALAKWAEAYFGDPDASGEDEGFIQVSDNVMKHIDLMFVHRNDLRTVLPHLHIFSTEVLANAKRSHVLTQSRDPQLYSAMGFRNTSRGSAISARRTRVRSLAGELQDIPENVQGLQNTDVSQQSEEMDSNPVLG